MLRQIFQPVRLGLGSLLLHKLRSALAVLGILIGVTAVIWLVAMGEGVSYQAQEQIKELGATNIILRSVKPPQERMRNDESFVTQYGLLREDFERIHGSVPPLLRAVPMRELAREIANGDRTLDGKLVGCTPEHLAMNRLAIARGRFLSNYDLRDFANVAVLGAGAARKLFSYENSIGRTIQIGDDFYLVIGQTQPRTPSAAIGGSLEARDFDDDVYIPLTTLRERIGDVVFHVRAGSFEQVSVQLSQITVTVGQIDEVEETASILRTLLKKYHKTADYAVVVPKELLRQAETMRAMFNFLLVVIAGISLLVGGIGIMNIMLATVTERTREIGIRRALGATRGDIVRQFLSETAVLTGLGGVLGVFSGFLCGPAVEGLRWLANRLVPDLVAALPPNLQQIEPRIAPWSIAVAFAISAAVGIVFGLYPAQRAANMDPIEALRHE